MRKAVAAPAIDIAALHFGATQAAMALSDPVSLPDAAEDVVGVQWCGIATAKPAEVLLTTHSRIAVVEVRRRQTFATAAAAVAAVAAAATILSRQPYHRSQRRGR